MRCLMPTLVHNNSLSDHMMYTLYLRNDYVKDKREYRKLAATEMFAAVTEKLGGPQVTSRNTTETIQHHKTRSSS